jgi:hypothetical protein
METLILVNANRNRPPIRDRLMIHGIFVLITLLHQTTLATHWNLQERRDVEYDTF